jgi:hypothetical protein
VDTLEILFNNDNTVSMLIEGKIVLQQNLHTFDVNNLKQFGLSVSELNKIKLIMNKRKFNFYT